MLELYIGNKNYSSWSMRPWFALRASGIAFIETVIPLYRDDSKARILAVSPSGKLPLLVDGEVLIWDSLAIIEYLAERFPDAGLWPRQMKARAQARAVAAEMHSGFAALRSECGMNLRCPVRAKTLSAAAQADIVRIQEIWASCRTQFGGSGPYLFGSFSAADAMYAPVVARFITYAIDVSPAARSYMAAIAALPAWKEWHEAALKEEWIIEKFEID